MVSYVKKSFEESKANCIGFVIYYWYFLQLQFSKLSKFFAKTHRTDVCQSCVKITNMGFEIKRFQGDVDEELICPICSGVLEDPLQVCVYFLYCVYQGNVYSVCVVMNRFFLCTQAPACEHAFCRACITEWISRQPTCPVDRQAVTASQLRPVPRILRNLLSR